MTVGRNCTGLPYSYGFLFGSDQKPIVRPACHCPRRNRHAGLSRLSPWTVTRDTRTRQRLPRLKINRGG